MPAEAEDFSSWLRAAAGSLVERSENLDPQGLVATFVDPGIEDRLNSKNNLVLYGRRGTGKTHVLNYLRQGVRSASRETGSRWVAVYLDLRAIGFGEDLDRPEEERRNAAPLLFAGFVGRFVKALGRELEQLSGGVSQETLSELEGLLAAVDGYTVVPTKVSQGDKQSHNRGNEIGVEVDLAKAGGRFKRERSDSDELTASAEGDVRPGFDFAALHDQLAALVNAAKLDRLVLVLDEWSSVDADVQPVLADYLRRWCLPIPAVTLTIAAIRGSTVLEGTTAGRRYGLQHGSDFQTVLDLDEYFVPEDHPKQKNERFQEMLYRHLCFHAANDARSAIPKTVRSSGGFFPKLKETFFSDHDDKDARHESLLELISTFEETMAEDPDWGRTFMENIGSQLLELQWKVTSAEDLAKAIFRSRGKPFAELVLASGGVFRDFLALLAKASTDNPTPTQIDLDAVRAAARDVFINGKQPNLKSNRKNFEALMAAVVEGGSRYFMIDPDGPNAEAVEKLVQLRAVHRVRRAMPDAESPGASRDLFAIDFGAALMQLQLVPDLVLQPERQLTSDRGVLEPFVDGRLVPRLFVAPAALSGA
jgi:hypothetical protein